jgi:hypothetical protein
MGVTITEILRILSAIVDSSTAVYAALFSVFVLLAVWNSGDFSASPAEDDVEEHHTVRLWWLYFDLFMWVAAEGMNAIATIAYRSCCVFFKVTVKRTQTLLILKLLSFAHYFVVLSATAGFMVRWVGSSSDAQLPVLSKLLLAFQISVFGLLGVLLLNLVLYTLVDQIYGKFRCGERSDSCLTLCVNMCVTIVDCFTKCVCFIPICVFTAFVSLVNAAVQTGMVAAIVGTCGIPFAIAECCYPDQLGEFIKIRAEIYGSPNKVSYFGLTHVCIFDWYITQKLADGVVSGLQLDACVACVMLLAPTILATTGVALWIIKALYPHTIHSVGSDILHGSKAFAALWIASKVVEVLVAVLVPFLQILRHGMYNRLMLLVREYAALVILHFQHVVLLRRILHLKDDPELSAEDREVLHDAETIVTVITHICAEKIECVEVQIKKIMEVLGDFEFPKPRQKPDADGVSDPLLGDRG